MRLIGELFSLEVASWLVRIIVVLGAKALDGGQRLKESAINREVIIGKQSLLGGLLGDLFQKPATNVRFDQTILIVGEHALIPDLVVDSQADEPAKGHVGIDAIHQDNMAADRVDELQYQTP